MTNLELPALQNLRKNPEIVIKPYDKGRGICILNRSDYLQVGCKHLESEHYTKPKCETTIISIITLWHTSIRAHKHVTFRQCIFYRKSTKPRRQAHLLFGRPIISGCSSPTAKISEFVDHFLLQIVTAQPTYVRDTADILRKLEGITFPQPRSTSNHLLLDWCVFVTVLLFLVYSLEHRKVRICLFPV